MYWRRLKIIQRSLTTLITHNTNSITNYYVRHSTFGCYQSLAIVIIKDKNKSLL